MKKHILLIDDDEDELIIFMDLLKKADFPCKCTWAKSGVQALSQLAYLIPDIIFLDMNMPGMNGLECLAAIRQMPHLRAIPVVLHSSVISEDCCSKGMNLGAVAYIEKTDTVSEVLKHLMAPEKIGVTE